MTGQPSLLDDLEPAAQTTGKEPPPQPRHGWLRDHLIASGHLTETGLARRARLMRCPEPDCRDQVLAGLDDDRCALEARTDATPLSALGEALAVVEGRPTYSLRREGPGWVLDRRDHHRIAWAPAGSQPRHDVVRQHRCGTPPPSGQLTTLSSFPEVAPPMSANATPPF